MNARYYANCEYTEINAAGDSECAEALQIKSSYARISVRAGTGAALEEKDCRMIDRTLEVKIPLQKGKMDYGGKIRMPVEKRECDHLELLRIAERNFKEDSRFYVTNGPNRNGIAEKILKAWVEEIKEPFVCVYRDEIIGFADVRFLEEYQGNPFVYLAAVDEKYRLTGAALSMYASVCAYYKERGKQYLYGRISSRNTAVMNLYASLGGQFLNPWDIFVKIGEKQCQI